MTPLEKDRFNCIRAGYGYYTFEVDDYSTFIHEIAPVFSAATANQLEGTAPSRPIFVWRGMRDPTWSLLPTFSRHASSSIHQSGREWQVAVSKLTTRHLIEYLVNLRGLGLITRQHDELYHLLRTHLGEKCNSFLSVLSKMSPEQLSLTHELFCMGQHHGLLTPFLDWTSIPLIALYFAFEGSDNRKDGVGYRVVFALNKTAVEKISPPYEAKGPEDIMILDSMAHDNPRIVAQAGMFTFVPAHLPVDKWVVKKCPAESTDAILIRFLIRNERRRSCLAELSASNINAKTIFPDRFGAAMHTNYLCE